MSDILMPSELTVDNRAKGLWPEGLRGAKTVTCQYCSPRDDPDDDACEVCGGLGEYATIEEMPIKEIYAKIVAHLGKPAPSNPVDHSELLKRCKEKIESLRYIVSEYASSHRLNDVEKLLSLDLEQAIAEDEWLPLKDLETHKEVWLNITGCEHCKRTARGHRYNSAKQHYVICGETLNETQVHGFRPLAESDSVDQS